MASLQRMSDATESVYESLLRLQNSLSDDDPLFGDLQTVHVLTNEHRVRADFDLARTPHTHTEREHFIYAQSPDLTCPQAPTCLQIRNPCLEI